MVVTGLERVLREPDILAGKGRLGLLYNQASVNTCFRDAAELMNALFPGRLSTLFGPQHGFGGTEPDNMIETGHQIHSWLGLPVISLYSETRKPSVEMLESVDTVLVDIQDVGTRVYTFATTALHLMEACSNAGKRMVVLDRPNPINGREVEGNVLDPEYASFVGPHPIPMRHGMTLGELMTFYNETFGVGSRLEVVEMVGWDRNMWFEDTGLPWVLPSPNMPLVETAVVYPGQVILEGTGLSEGRGTTRPFEIFGSPYLEPARVAAAIEPQALDGAILRFVDFRPTFNKWADHLCRGFQIHVIDRNTFRPYRASLAMISAIIKLYPDDFKWSNPPYEYVSDKLPADIILGDRRVRAEIEQGRSVLDMEREWLEDLKDFRSIRSRFLLYPG